MDGVSYTSYFLWLFALWTLLAQRVFMVLLPGAANDGNSRFDYNAADYKLKNVIYRLT
jgi:hypothetical protein